MKHATKILAALAIAGSATAAASATLQLDLSFDVSSRAPVSPLPNPDTNMLDGSRFRLIALFGNVAFTDPLNNGFTRAVASSVSVFIDRAGMDADETATVADDVGLFGGTVSGLFRSAPDSFFGLADGAGCRIGGLINSAKLDVLDGTISGAAGDALTLSDLLGLTSVTGIGTVDAPGRDNYASSNYSFSAVDLMRSRPGHCLRACR